MPRKQQIKDGVLLELGCGNGRDTLYFHKERPNLEILAIDECEAEIDFLNKYTNNKLHFMADDFTNLNFRKNIDYTYARFVLHSITEKQENNTINWVYENLNMNGLFFIEVRSIYDELCGVGEKISDCEFVATHYRRFIKIEELIFNLKSRGFDIEYVLESNGLAISVCKQKDPRVIRIIAKKGRNIK